MTVFKVFHVSLQKTRFLKTKKSPVLLRPPQRELTRSSAFWVSDKTSAASLDSILQVNCFMRVLRNDFSHFHAACGSDDEGGGLDPPDEGIQTQRDS